MSCKACADFQNGAMTSFFRWKNANVEIRACEEHLNEVFTALRIAQKLPMLGKDLADAEDGIEALKADFVFIRDQARDITEAKGRAMMALRRLEGG